MNDIKELAEHSRTLLDIVKECNNTLSESNRKILFDRMANLYWPEIKGYNLEEGYGNNIGNDLDGIDEVTYQHNDKGYVVTINLKGMQVDVPDRLRKKEGFFEVFHAGESLKGSIKSFEEVPNTLKKIEKWATRDEKMLPKKIPNYKGWDKTVVDAVDVEYTKELERNSDINISVLFSGISSIISNESSLEEVFITMNTGSDYNGSYVDYENTMTYSNIKDIPKILGKAKKIWNSYLSAQIERYEKTDAESLANKYKNAML